MFSQEFYKSLLNWYTESRQKVLESTITYEDKLKMYQQIDFEYQKSELSGNLPQLILKQSEIQAFQQSQPQQFHPNVNIIKNDQINQQIQQYNQPVINLNINPQPINKAVTLQNKQIVGYYPSWCIYARKYFVNNIPFQNITKILYAFLNIQNDGKVALCDQWADIEIEFPQQNAIKIQSNANQQQIQQASNQNWQQQIKGNFQEIAKAKQIYPHIDMAVSIGGWTFSKQFHSMKNVQKRRVFIDSVIQFLQKYDMFDSVDIDWEHPNRPGDNNAHGPEDTETLTSLVIELHQALQQLQPKIDPAQNNQSFQQQNQKQASKSHRKRCLTLALAAQEVAMQWVQYDKIWQYLDSIYLMTYDIHGAWDLNCTGHNSPLVFDGKDPYGEGNNIQFAVNYLLGKGVPREKIVVGASFYGRSWAGVSDDEQVCQQQQGYQQINEGKIKDLKKKDQQPLYKKAMQMGPGTFGEADKGVLQYNDIVQNYVNKKGFTYYWDEDSQAAYLYNGNIFISYDSVQAIDAKCNYVSKEKLGGIFFWEFSGDTADHELVKRIFNNFKKEEK